jgi:hypothetical protein
VIAFPLGLVACASPAESDATGSTVAEIEQTEDSGIFCDEPGRFEVTGGVVLDDADDAGLVEWQRSVAPAMFTQPEAVAYCASLVLGGGGGWRLPTAQELHSLDLHPLGLGGSQAPVCIPSIDQVAFPGTPPYDFWSSTTRPALQDAMYTDFFDGRSHADLPSTPMYVRCVRTGGGLL